MAAQWISAVRGLPHECAAIDLYAGRAFSLAKDAATAADSPLFVISAGLGLVFAETPVPAYGLTTSHGGEQTIQHKVCGAFDAAEWFAAVSRGLSGVGWDNVFGRRASGRVLIALTRPYAELVAPALASLQGNALDRLRLFGAGLTAFLPPPLQDAVVPYDDRLNALLPGTRSDFAQRALLHFVQRAAGVTVDRRADHDAVRRSLDPVHAPCRPQRRRASDAVILSLIKGRLTPIDTVSRSLRQLRDVDHIACEQVRFADLFQRARAEAFSS